MSESKESKGNKEFGFNLYPERRSGKAEYTWWDRLTTRSDNDVCKAVCEENVEKAFKKNPIVKILVGALKNAGCPFNLNRHVVCEVCGNKVQGGYDSEYNQIVVCQNTRKARKTPDVILVHELIHMYDYCVNELDFKNLEHLACTEIRAANMVHCSFISSLLVGQSSFFDIRNTHQDCVKLRATYSLVVSRNLEFKTALSYVLKVFDKCYNDLEPIGRRFRRKSLEPLMAYEEGKCFKVCE